MAFVVIDFEATCDEPYNPTPREIIELPAVLVEADGTPGPEFRTFVRPVARPRLTSQLPHLGRVPTQPVDHARQRPLEAGDRLQSHHAVSHLA
jgi:inhibitor of KinA sporulation pathway (predicted exonuclease)